ncbi:MAG: ATP synthase epsilon chain [Ignavibacteriae bacterium]|nr:MAG: ATP synthase epsilon chain [Ignavibacteriota bacterium]
MFDKPFKLEIISPNKVIYRGEAFAFTAPGVTGSFQVLYNHAPLISEIGIGLVKITTTSGEEKKFATSGGFVEVKDNSVVMLAETIEAIEEIDLKRAEAAMERAKKRLRERKPGTDLQRAEIALQRALNRIRLVRLYRI